jgi:hypothetical protein
VREDIFLQKDGKGQAPNCGMDTDEKSLTIMSRLFTYLERATNPGKGTHTSDSCKRSEALDFHHLKTPSKNFVPENTCSCPSVDL